jgi:hypothetical protein
MAKLLIKSVLAAVAIVGATELLGAPRSDAANSVVFKIWNDTTVPIKELYDKDSRHDYWGINDLSTPVAPGHYFYIKFEQNSYAHCPSMLHDVKLIFANGQSKILTKIKVCEYDVHINKP